MDDMNFSKSELIELSGILPNNLTHVSRHRLISPIGVVRRGQRPRYSFEEVLKLAVMEKARSLRVPYEASASFFDELKEKIEGDKEAQRRAGNPGFESFFDILKTKLTRRHVAWITIQDDKPKRMFLWGRHRDDPQPDEFGTMAATEAMPADGFEHFVILNITPLIWKILEVAGRSPDER